MGNKTKRAENDLLAEVTKEMAAPRMSNSARKAEQDFDTTAEKPSATMVRIVGEPERPSDTPSVTMQGAVEKIIPAIGGVVPEKVQIAVEGAEPLYREIRIDNALQTGNGDTSNLEVGSKVSVTIQVKPDHPTSPQIGVASADDQSAARIIRILVADDHPTILRIVKLILKAQSGFEVVGEARDGEQAVDLAESLKPDVVVINVTMPKMSGFEAARRIRAQFSNCAIVILSNNKDRQFVEEARKVGANGYVHKSTADAQLILAIESAVKGKEFYFVE